MAGLPKEGEPRGIVKLDVFSRLQVGRAEVYQRGNGSCLGAVDFDPEAEAALDSARARKADQEWNRNFRRALMGPIKLPR